MGNKELYIIGASGFAREVRDWVEQCGFTVSAFIDPALEGAIVDGLPVLKDEQTLLTRLKGKKLNFVIGIGSPKIRKRIVEELNNYSEVVFPNILCPDVVFGKNVKIEEDSGVILCPGNVLTTNIILKQHVVVNLSCTIGHDCILEDYVMLSPGCNLSGKVNVGEGSYLGTGSTILEELEIGSRVTVGAQAAVVKSVPNDVTVVGVPAKTIGTRQ